MVADYIKVKDKKFEKYIDNLQIMQCVKNISEKLNQDLKGKNPIFLSVLNGSFMFASDLMKEISIKCTISFVKLASYSGTSSTGKIRELIGINEDIKDKTVVVLEDIVDTGNTLENIINELNKYNPKEILVCTLILKPEVYNKNIKIDYYGMKIPDEFIVGYGLDYNSEGRNNKNIYKII